jgi:hypothetical protein
MDLAHAKYGKPNPHAPRELSQFAFLIGQWRCESQVKGQDGVFRTYSATWVGRYILDGYVIADEFRQMGPAGELLQLGQNYRSYNTDKNTWIMKWHDALASTWLDLGPDELGGVQMNDTSITFKHHVPPGPVAAGFPRMQQVAQLPLCGVAAFLFRWRWGIQGVRERAAKSRRSGGRDLRYACYLSPHLLEHFRKPLHLASGSLH